ncbi:MAG: hypothetical protein ACXVCY_00195 [Pseudobdellovibrionaceae bacterium]
MNKILKLLIQTSCSFLFFDFSMAWGWSDHHLITKEILKDSISAEQKVPYTPLSDFLRSAGLIDENAFKIQLKINKNYQFKNKINEETARELSVLDILSIYSDEPDWGMDQELFSADQYPELWKDEYAMMGGRSGLSSQAFRHMYWRELYWKHPLESFKLPLQKINSSAGEAPQRAEVFIHLAKLAFAKNLPYWGWRFTANSLHYIEDVSQPFHSSQVPSKILIDMVLLQCITSRECSNFVGRMTNIISYYHFAYEDTMSFLFKSDKTNLLSSLKPNPIQSLNNNHSWSYLNMSPEKMTVQMSELSNTYSARAGRSSISFFPFFSGSYAELDANTFMNEAWWKTNERNLTIDSSKRKNYLSNINSMFFELGDAVRCWIKNLEAQ